MIQFKNTLNDDISCYLCQIYHLLENLLLSTCVTTALFFLIMLKISQNDEATEYMSKLNSRNTRHEQSICSKLKISTQPFQWHCLDVDTLAATLLNMNSVVVIYQGFCWNYKVSLFLYLKLGNSYFHWPPCSGCFQLYSYSLLIAVVLNPFQVNVSFWYCGKNITKRFYVLKWYKKGTLT